MRECQSVQSRQYWFETLTSDLRHETNMIQKYLKYILEHLWKWPSGAFRKPEPPFAFAQIAQLWGPNSHSKGPHKEWHKRMQGERRCLLLRLWCRSSEAPVTKHSMIQISKCSRCIPSGNLTVCYGRSQVLKVNDPKISKHVPFSSIFHSHVKLQEDILSILVRVMLLFNIFSIAIH